MDVCNVFCFVFFQVNSELLGQSFDSARPTPLKQRLAGVLARQSFSPVRRSASFLGSGGQRGGEVTGVVAERANTFECRAC